MGLGGILQELKREGVLALYHDYRSGRLVDWSGNGNNGVLNTNFIFNKSGLRAKNGSAIIVPYSATWAWNTQVTIINGHLNMGYLMTTANSNYASYHSNPRLQLFRVGDTIIAWSDGVNLRTLSLNTNNYTYNSISIANGTSGLVYCNGIYQGALAGASIVEAPTVNNIELCLPQVDPFWVWITTYNLIIKRVLTATEHARVYAQLENMTWNTKGLTPGPMMP